MSTGTIAKQADKENSVNTDIVKKMSLTSGSNDRKTLKTLQLTSDGKLMGLEKSMHKSRIVPSKKPVRIFPDTSTPKPVRTYKNNEIGIQVSINQQESETQTDISGATGISMYSTREAHNDSGVGATDFDQEAYDLMVKDPIPESYWRELAEERRLSLAEALSENETLHQSMEELKEENHNLSLLAGQAEHLAAVLNNVLGEDDDKDALGVDGDKDEETGDDTKQTDDSGKCEPTEDETNKCLTEDETKATEPEKVEEKNSS